MFQRPVSSSYAQFYVKRTYDHLPDFKKIVKDIPISLENKVILDLASGPGQFAVIFDEYKPKKIICQDKWKEYLKEAKKRHKKHNIKTPITYTHEDMMKLPYKNQSIDIIFCNVSFFYAANEKKIIKRFADILTDEGVVYIRTHTLQNIHQESWNSFIKYISYVFYYVNKVIPWKLFPVAAQSPKSLKKLFRQSGFTIIKEEVEADIFTICAQYAPKRS